MFAFSNGLNKLTHTYKFYKTYIKNEFFYRQTNTNKQIFKKHPKTKNTTIRDPSYLCI